MPDLASQLFTLQRALGLKKKEDLAKQFGISRTMLYNYEQNDPPPPPEFLSRMAEMMKDIPHEHMLTRKPHPRLRKASEKMIPVVGWAHAGEAGNYESVPDSWQEWIPTECRDPKAFAVKLEGDSMEPQFRELDLLVLMPSEKPYSGCFVVCRFQNDSIVFRGLETAGDTIRLVPLNDRYPVSEHKCEEFIWMHPVWGRWSQLWKR